MCDDSVSSDDEKKLPGIARHSHRVILGQIKKERRRYSNEEKLRIITEWAYAKEQKLRMRHFQIAHSM